MGLTLRQTHKLKLSRDSAPRRNEANVRRKAPRDTSHIRRLVRKGLSWTGGIVLGMVFFGLLTMGLLVGYRYITGVTFFALNSVDIQGNSRLSRLDVLDQAQLTSGQNTLDINLVETKERLLAHPWVKEVSLKRVLPSTFNIFIEEKQPAFLLREGDALLYADENGRAIAPVTAAAFVGLPQLITEETSPDVLEQLPSIMAELSKSSFYRVADAAWIKFGAVEGVEIYFSKPNLRIAMDREGMPGQVARINQVWADLNRRGESAMVRGILSMGGNVWVDMGTAARKPAGDSKS